MEPLAALAIPFVTDAPMHGMDYFTPANLRGAIISMVIGLLVYLYVVRRFLSGRKRRQPLSQPLAQGLNLENRVYRPLLLKALPFLGAVPARLAETLVDGTLSLISRALYHRQTSTVEPVVVRSLPPSPASPVPGRASAYSFAYSLMLMGLGIAFWHAVPHPGADPPPIPPGKPGLRRAFFCAPAGGRTAVRTA